MPVEINGRVIDNFGQPYLISEIGANHNGDLELAKKLVQASAEAGAHCVKFQSWTKESIFSAQVYRDNYFLGDDYRQRQDYSLEQIVEEFSLGRDELAELKRYCDQLGVDFSSSVFSPRETDFLVCELGAPFVKIASMDITNLPFLAYVADQMVPLVLSTGLSTLDEVVRAVQVIESRGNRQLVILHCVSHYPPQDHNVHLNNLDMLRAVFPDYPIGFSDHSLGTAIPLAAAAKGAAMLEKHFTLDKEMFGWDHQVSADRRELAEIAEGIGRIHAALGSTRRVLSDQDYQRRPAYRRSVVAAADLARGQRLTREMVDFKRPGTGIGPDALDLVLDRRLKKDIAADELIHWEDLS